MRTRTYARALSKQFGNTSCSGLPAGSLAATVGFDDSVTSYTYNPRGQVTRIQFAGTSDYVEREYDELHRLIAETDTRLNPHISDLGGYGFAYDYDAQDRLASVTYPGGGVVAYTYDNLGRPAR